jgi:ATP-binding cassette subfamily B protein
VLAFTSTRLVGITAQKILFTLRERVFTHVQRLDLGYHEKSTSGRLVSRQTSDMESVQQFLSYSLFDTALALLQMIFIAVTLVVLDVPLALVVFAGFIPLFFITKAAHSTQRSAYRRTRTSIAKVIVHFVETMGGIRAVQAYPPAARTDAATLSDRGRQYRDANTDALRGVAWFAGWTRLIGNVTQTVIIVVGAWLVIDRTGRRSACSPRSSSTCAGSTARSTNSSGRSTSISPPRRRWRRSRRPRHRTRSDPTPPSPRSCPRGSRPGQRPLESISTQVRFAYGDGPDVLPRFDLRIPAGQIVALVGATGAGKSTLVKLVTRFYDPSEGESSIDGGGSARPRRCAAAPGDRHGHPGVLPLRRHDRRQHPHRQPRGHR